ncbi:MAG: 2-oxoglutarate dehydrogenase, E2 component, dihydrolipoamide succinyltransferase [Rhodothermales bacterium]|nr:2-oxoglutarate dehydrogenase, E2 component, dihydrolipoamide succinyltransferase [Rhodothermales bacterium]
MAKVEVSMPKMGESITEGTVIEWFKQPGDAVEEDETLLEIGTDKVDTEVPSPAGGVLAEIRVAAGDTVEVGTIIALIETDADAAVNGQADAPDDGASEEDAGAAASADSGDTAGDASSDNASDDAPGAGAGSDSPDEGGNGVRVEIEMPKMGESIMEGTIIAWHKQPGDSIEEDETLLEIATDKVDTDVPSPASGTVLELLAEEGETVEVGTIIAVIGSGDARPAGGPKSSSTTKQETKTSEAQSKAAAEQAPDRPATSSGRPAETGPIPRQGPNGEFFSPLVRSIAEEEGVSVDELASIDGSGRDGRITKKDLLAYVEKRSKAPAGKAAGSGSAAKPSARPASGPPPLPSGVKSLETRDDGRVEVLKMDRMRQIIAEHMTRSKSTSAHVTSFAEADVTNLVRLRERQKKAFQAREGIKLTYTPFFVYAAVQALRDHPILNASVEGDEILLKKDYHVGIAVAIGKTGLLAPVIRHAGQKNIAGLAHAANDLAERARNKQLLPDQLQGGTFTVTNIGSLGSIMGTPIINQPQVGILATGAIKKRPVVVEDPDLGDIIAVRQMMYISLSYDHRIVDGAMGASFLARFVEVLQELDPETEI